MATRRKAPDIDLLPPGTLLARAVIPMRAVPWKAPTVTRYGTTYKDKALLKWQATVKIFAGMASPSYCYAGPVEVSVSARFAKGPLPDATNILKAIEDALQGVVFVNDRQVVRNRCERSKTGFDRVTIEVTAAEPSEDDQQEA